MLRSFVVALAAALMIFGADDPWAKVKELKSGTELRIVKTGSAQPMLATFDELTDERLLVATKKEQLAIPLDDIQRIDYRPPQKASRVQAESKTKATDTVSTAGRYPGGRSGQSVESSSGLTISGKSDFETIYRRTAAAPKKSTQ
jgi:hypothetical protein